MNIYFNDYLTEGEIKTIVQEEFRRSIQRQMNTEEAVKRILSNAAYDVVWKIADECFDDSSKQLIKKNVDKILDQQSSYTIFKRPDAWSKETNTAYDFLQECVRKNKGKVEQKVEEILDKQVVAACKKDVKEIISDVLRDYVEEL